jgi:nitrogen fixation/metabolism regulation signal transduction histidine kinase
MTTYVQVARALVTSGYLSEADLEAATAVLADALLVSAAQEAEVTALNDEAFQEAVMAEAEERAVEAAIVGDFEGEILADQMKADAQAAELQDDVIIAEAEATKAATYRNVAAALLAAELIDEANLEAVTKVIAEVWVDADA